MMHRKDYEALAAAVRAGLSSADSETQPGGALSDLGADQVRRVAAALIGEVAEQMADCYHAFNADAWLSEVGLAAEVAALRPAESVREYGAPLAFDDVQMGDWIRYVPRPHHPVIGRVRRCADQAVSTEHEYVLSSGVSRPKGSQLRRSGWGRLHVSLVAPAEVWWHQDAEGGEEAGEHHTRRRPGRLPRAEAAQRAMAAARAFLRQHGHLRVPAKHVEDGYRLGGWISSQRYDYRRGIISPDRLRELDALDVSWRDGCEVGVHR